MAASVASLPMTPELFGGHAFNFEVSDDSDEEYGISAAKPQPMPESPSPPP